MQPGKDKWGNAGILREVANILPSWDVRMVDVEGVDGAFRCVRFVCCGAQGRGCISYDDAANVCNGVHSLVHTCNPFELLTSCITTSTPFGLQH